MKKITYKGVDETVYYEKLNNGLEVFMYPVANAKNFYLTFSTKYGSVDTIFKNKKDKSWTEIPYGTAHYLEHQLFTEEDGTTAFTKFAKLGSSINAFTSYDITCYEVIASSDFKENLETLLDYVQNPYFTPESVKKERGIIKEEIKMYENMPAAVLSYGLEYNVNNVDKHKYEIAGTVDDIKGVTPEVLYTTYNSFYTPNNMFIVLTGKFNPNEALGIIKENQSKKEFPLPTKVVRKKEHEPIEVAVPYEERKMDVGIPKLKVAYKIDKSLFDGLTDLEIKVYLSAILNIIFGPTSDAYEKMVESNLITPEVYTQREVRDDYVLVAFEAETEYKEQVLDIVREELNNIKISKEELERYKKYSIGNFILHFNDIIAVCEDIQDDILYNSKIQDNILDIYRSLDLSIINKIVGLIDTKHESVFFIDRLD